MAERAFFQCMSSASVLRTKTWVRFQSTSENAVSDFGAGLLDEASLVFFDVFAAAPANLWGSLQSLWWQARTEQKADINNGICLADAVCQPIE